MWTHIGIDAYPHYKSDSVMIGTVVYVTPE